MTSKKRKKRRKQIRQERLAAKHKGEAARVRQVFVAKARSGDLAELDLVFSGQPVLVDLERPEDLAKRAQQDEAWSKAGHPVKGSA